MYTVGRLAAKHGLSRSTLLYYDRLGLLRPSAGGQGDYRRYGPQEDRRLAQICLYRRAGLSLKEIARVLEAPDSRLAQALEGRLNELNQEMERLRAQQRFILGILRDPRAARRAGALDRQAWVELLAASGFGPQERQLWHAQFERLAPEGHREFLAFLGLEPQEAEQVRQHARSLLAQTAEPRGLTAAD